MLTAVIIAALWITGVYRITQPGEPFYFVRKILDKIGLKDGQARKWYYPVLYCPVCMSSLHGVFVFMLFLWAGFSSLFSLPFFLVLVYGLVEFLNNQRYD